MTETKKILFIISPIGSEGTSDYFHFRKVRKHLIDKVATEKGYVTIRADDISEPGKITSQIINQLRKADLVVADLSNKNPNVFYELAIRDATRKPVILISDQTADIPFDVRPQRLLKYSIDLDEIDESRRKLSDFIDATEDPDYQTTSPVTEALITPSDEISASSQEYFELILNKLSSMSSNTARSQAPRSVARAIEEGWIPRFIPKNAYVFRTPDEFVQMKDKAIYQLYRIADDGETTWNIRDNLMQAIEMLNDNSKSVVETLNNVIGLLYVTAQDPNIPINTKIMIYNVANSLRGINP